MLAVHFTLLLTKKQIITACSLPLPPSRGNSKNHKTIRVTNHADNSHPLIFLIANVTNYYNPLLSSDCTVDHDAVRDVVSTSVLLI